MARRDPPAPRRNSLVASAAIMSSRPQAMAKLAKSSSWQEDAWRFYDEVGELRFGIGWLANGMSRVNLVAALQPEHQGDEPSAIEIPDPDDPEATPLTSDELAAVELVAAIAGGSDGQGQMLAASCIQLSVPGIGYLLMEAEVEEAEVENEPGRMVVAYPVSGGDGEDEEPQPDETWTWRVLAADEVRSQGDLYEVATGQGQWRPVATDHVLVKMWRPHPRRSWEPDSPCRAVIGVLRQISLLDEHVQATATSRLAGAGLLVLPTEAEFVPMPRPGQPVDAELTEDTFTDTLVDTMTLPIGDRGTAAAVVPLTVRIPGEYCDKPQHITFWSEFSDNLLPLRNSAVQRLALGLDLPPETLLGVAGMNHWGAWQVAEEAVTLHVEPMSETICHALTIGFYRPALEAAGVEDPSRFMVWYDTTDLTTRPDRSADAISAYDRIELSGQAMRRESGLSEDDAPDPDEVRERRLWELAKANPQMAPTFLDMIDEMRSGGELVPLPVPAPPADEENTDLPATEDDQPDDGEPPGLAASAVVEACDGLVYRALERAGGRLRSAAGRKVNGGAAAIACDDVTTLHVTLGGATKFADLDELLAGAWERTPVVARRYDLDPEALRATLDGYTRALLATGHGHDRHRLADALGFAAAAV